MAAWIVQDQLKPSRSKVALPPAEPRNMPRQMPINQTLVAIAYRRRQN